jgi:hypothetical protein
MTKWFAALACCVTIATARAEPEGRFEGRVLAEWLNIPFVAAVKLEEGFGFRDATGKLWSADRGMIIDGSGMPPLFREIVGSPFEGAHRKSSLLYEAQTLRMTENWEASRHMFLEAVLVEGVSPPDAKVMYLLLAIQGSRWETRGSRCFGSCHGSELPLFWRPVVDEGRTAKLVDWVRNTNPPLDEVDARAKTAIRARGPHIFTQPECDNMFSGSTRVRKSCD